MMNEKVKQHLIAYNKKMAETHSGFDLHEDDPIILQEELLETLFDCGNEVYREKGDSHRWWNDVWIVKDIDGMLIGYDGAETTGDNSPTEVGWEFNDSSICEVKAVTKTITTTVYEPI